MSRMVISASPLVKIFLVEWHQRLMKDNTLIYDNKTPFEFDIPRGTAAFRCKFNQPVEIRGRDDQEIEALYLWLIGGPNGHEYEETACFGTVAYEPGLDLVGRLDEMARLEEIILDDSVDSKKAAAELKKIRAEAKDAMLSARSTAIAKSEVRIKRAIVRNHQFLLKQWQINDEMKMGRQQPSIAEYLGSFALESVLKEKEAEQAESLARISKMMESGNVVVSLQ